MSRFMTVTNKNLSDWHKSRKNDRNEEIRDLYLEGWSFGDIVKILPEAGFKKISRQRIGKIWKDYFERKHWKELQDREPIDKTELFII